MQFENFYKISAEKQDIIINGGLLCFGKNGYDKTSMSDVAKASGISKAALFHYFSSKKKFYLFLYDFACKKIIEEMREGTEDFFESLILGSEIKLRVMKSYKGIYEFLLSIVKEENQELLSELENFNREEVKAASQLLFKNVDWGKLRPEVDGDMAFRMVTYISNGYIKDHIDMEGEEILKNLKPMLNLLKNAIYREECL